MSDYKIKIAEPNIIDEDAKAMYNAVKEHRLSSGYYVEKFEKAFANYVGTKEAIAVNSGTSALHLALESLGVRKGEVITTPFTFAATANVIVLQNAKPVFVDIETDTYNLDPVKLEKAITPNTKAIMPIDYGGQCAKMDEINEIAKKHNLPVVEDAAPALGALYKGRKAGTLTEIAGFSFFPDKNMTTGTGGMIVTNDLELAEKCRIMRKNGALRRYYHTLIGWNFTMPDPNAALGLSQMKRIESVIEAKNCLAKYYESRLKSIKGIIPPKVLKNNRHTFMLYSILTESYQQREKVKQLLEKKRIETRINFPPVHLQPIYEKLFGFTRGLCPIAERVSEEILGLPIFIKMTQEQQDLIIDTVREAVDS